MISNTPSAPFSMSFTPPLAKSNEKLADAMKKLSATKHGRPRAEVEIDIAKRIASKPAAIVGPGGPPTGNRIGAPGAQKPGVHFLTNGLRSVNRQVRDGRAWCVNQVSHNSLVRRACLVQGSSRSRKLVQLLCLTLALSLECPSSSPNSMLLVGLSHSNSLRDNPRCRIFRSNS